MPEFFGLCGRTTPTPCKIVWASSYRNLVGTYPDSLLPAGRTIWHFAADGRYKFSPAPELPEVVGILGGGIIGPIFGGTLIPQVETFIPQSHFSIIFAKTANRLNVPHIITQQEMDSMDSAGIGKINVGEYIFEAVAVTDQIEVINTQLTPKDLDDIKKSGEEESDRAFRKIFEVDIPPGRNRFKAIEVNKSGVEYRLDNGGPKANSALNLAGIGDLNNASYKDASSRILLVDLAKVTERLPLAAGAPQPPAGSLQAVARPARAGDIIYLTYIAVSQHYIRQSVEIGWTMQATPTPAPACFSFPSKVRAVHYRFYEWDIGNATSRTRLAGWRAVESFNAGVNFVATMRLAGSPVLGDFVIGGGTGVITLSYMPADVTFDELEEFRTNKGSLPTYDVNLNQAAGIFGPSGVNYHPNVGSQGDPDAYFEADWYTRNAFRTFTDHREPVQHVIFNVHSKTMKKRDVDKFAIERFLAIEVEKDVKSGLNTFFPFMDDPAVDVPTDGALDYLSSQNFKIDPIKPISQYSLGNAEIQCAVGGAAQLGFTGSGGDDVFAAFAFTSNIITERFNKETRILVERHFTLGQRGLRFVAIQGLKSPRGAVSCIQDPSGQFVFTVHINSDNFLAINYFNNGFYNVCLQKLVYRPDIRPPTIINNTDPQPSQFEEYVGMSGMLGDRPGFSPGRAISVSSFLPLSLFRYKTTSAQFVKNRIDGVTDSQIEEIEIVEEDDRIIIPLELGYYGRTEVEYELEGEPENVMFLFKSGNVINGSIDSVYFVNREELPVLIVDHRWMKADSIEIVGPGSVVVRNISVHGVEGSYADDFLDEQQSPIRLYDGHSFFQTKMFFKTDVMSIGEDKYSHIFVFFNDQHDGISAVASYDFGKNWSYFYGVSEAIQSKAVRHPFVVNSFETNQCYLFSLYEGKITCKTFGYELFNYNDAFTIERFEKDILVVEGETIRENTSLYSVQGQQLRRKQSNVAAGDLGDKEFLLLLGKDVDNQQSDVFEEHQVEGQQKTKKVRKNSLAIGTSTAFTHRNISDSFFSAYRTNAGELRLFFMSPVEGSPTTPQLQCNFSVDDGINWYDLLEFVEHGYARFRSDELKKTNFIDRTAGNQVPDSIFATDQLLTDELAAFGINVHWSRLFRHKEEGQAIPDGESIPIPIDSPYAFYQPSSQKVFLFYVYQNCLLCKVFSDDAFKTAAKDQGPDGGVAMLKDVIERQTRSYFIDGDLSGTDIREEIHHYVNPDTHEKIANGNIIFHHHFGIVNFTEDRSLSAQRVCALELPNHNIRVFYRNDKDKNLHAASWNGSHWYVEDFMRNPETNPFDGFPDPIETEEVEGGFSGSV